MIRSAGFCRSISFRLGEGRGLPKEKMDTSAARLFCWEEGLCVQQMHIGPYDNEPATIAQMEAFVRENGYQEDFCQNRFHHEIYLSDPRRTAPEKLKTIIRHPVR